MQINKIWRSVGREILHICNQTILLSRHLDILQNKIGSANTLKEFFEVFDFVRSLKIRFIHKNHIIFFTICSLCFSIYLFICLFNLPIESIAIGFAISAILLIMIFVIRTRMNNIADLIVLKKVALDNSLVFDENDKKKMLRCFENIFLEFTRGNYARELIRYIKGENENKFIYHYFHFHYIDAFTTTSTDSNGNTKSTTTYSHYDRYGIIVPFGMENFIEIASYRPIIKGVRWKTSSISFNKKFKVYTDHEQTAALFLPPKVIEQIEKAYGMLSDINIEISDQGFLALSTSDVWLLNFKRQYGLDKLDLFKNEIKEVLNQIKLHQALNFINFLKEYHTHA